LAGWSSSGLMVGFRHCVITGFSRGSVEQALSEITIASTVSEGLSGLSLKVIDHPCVVLGGGLELIQLGLERFSGRSLRIGQLLRMTGP
jgi:hypothetical protein